MEQIILALVVSILLAWTIPLTKEENGEQFMSKINLSKLKKAYGQDQTKVNEGVWFDSSMIPGLSMKIAKVGNTEYEKLLRKLYKPYRKTLQKGKDLDTSITDNIMAEVIANTIVLDWKGMPGEEGDVPFSVEECMNLVLDPELREFKEEILEFADDSARYELEMDEETEKN